MMIFQSYLLINEYTKYATILNIEIKKTDKFDIPAVSICHLNKALVSIAKQMMLTFPEYNYFIRNLMNGTLNEKNKKIRAEIETYKYYSETYNRDLSLSIYFNRHRIGCRLDNRSANIDCKKVIKTINSINDDMECNTFFSRINSNDWKYFRNLVSNSTTEHMSEFRILPKMYKSDEIEKLFMGKNF
jgi:hypothetical protein